MNSIARAARRDGVLPLVWSGGTSEQNYLNFGDALSPVMVALLSGRPVRRVPSRSETPRLVAVGTIGQNVKGGEAWFWGTGCSPRALGEDRDAPFVPDPALRAHVAATRGPLSAALLGGGRLATDVFGDPVHLLPRFYDPHVEKRWDIGVILHLSELADRDVVCRPKPGLACYAVDPVDAPSVRLINTVTEISADALRAKLDEILACRRIVSTSLHGLVLAESYRIPSLTLTHGPGVGLATLPLTPDAPLDARMIDLYMGYGRDETPVWRQPRTERTDWAALADAVDRAWEPGEIDAEALMEVFPADLAPLRPEEGRTIWDHPVIRGLDFAHDVKALRAEDAARGAELRAAEAGRATALDRRAESWGLLTEADTPDAPPPRSFFDKILSARARR